MLVVAAWLVAACTTSDEGGEPPPEDVTTTTVQTLREEAIAKESKLAICVEAEDEEEAFAELGEVMTPSDGAQGLPPGMRSAAFAHTQHKVVVEVDPSVGDEDFDDLVKAFSISSVTAIVPGSDCPQSEEAPPEGG